MLATKLGIAIIWFAGTLAFGQSVDKSLTFDATLFAQPAPLVNPPAAGLCRPRG